MGDGGPERLSGNLLQELFGGGSIARLPQAFVTESVLLDAVASAVKTDFEDRTSELRRIWQRQAQDNDGSLKFSDFKSVLQSVEPGLPLSMVRVLFLSAVDASRACTQLEGFACNVHGTLEPDQTRTYGGEVVTLKLLLLTLLRHDLVLRDAALRRPLPSSLRICSKESPSRSKESRAGSKPVRAASKEFAR